MSFTPSPTLAARPIDHSMNLHWAGSGSGRGEEAVPFENRALYLQVRDALAERIASGEWKPGFALPNEGDLARAVGVSSGTVRKALELMEGARLIVRRQGRGTFVNDQASHELEARFSNLRCPNGELVLGEVKSATIAHGPASEIECARLRLDAGDPVHRIQRVRHQRGQIALVEETTLPAALFPALVDNGDAEFAGSIGGLAQKYGILLGGAEVRISAAAARENVADALGIVAGTPVIQLDRVSLMLNGRRPVEWCIVHCHLTGAYYLASIA
jgi:GntR family transcriptional regulator